MKYEVQEFTLCDGWVNNWTVQEGDKMCPEIFENAEDARRAIYKFFEDIGQENKTFMGGFDRENYRIMHVDT